KIASQNGSAQCSGGQVDGVTRISYGLVAAAAMSVMGTLAYQAQLAGKAAVGNHNARFDLHLADRNVEIGNHAPDFLQPLCRFVDQQAVGALIDRDATAIGQHRALLAAVTAEQ